MRAGAFAIGSGYVYAFKFLMRVIHGFAKGQGIVQVFFKSGRPYTGKHGELTVQVFKRLLIVHSVRKI